MFFFCFNRKWQITCCFTHFSTCTTIILVNFVFENFIVLKIQFRDIMATYVVSGLNSISSISSFNNNNFRSKKPNILLGKQRILLFNWRRRRSLFVNNVASDQKQKTKDSSSDEGTWIILFLIYSVCFNLFVDFDLGTRLRSAYILPDPTRGISLFKLKICWMYWKNL